MIATEENCFKNDTKDISKKSEMSREQKCKKAEIGRLLDTSPKRPAFKFAFFYVQAVILLQTGTVYRERGK